MSPMVTGGTSLILRHRLGRRALRRRRVLVPVGGGDEGGEQRVRPGRLRFELGMELHGDVPRVAGQLRDLDELAVGRSPGDAQPVLGERALVQTVELVAVAMALVDQRGAVDALRQRARRQLAGVRAEAHRAAEIVDAEQVAELVDHLGRRIGRAFGRIGVLQARHVPGVLDGRPLEAVADAEVGDAALARNLRRFHHAARAAVAEAARHQDALGVVEQRFAARRLERLGLDPLDVDLEPLREPAVVQRFVEALVGVLVADILADDVDRQIVDRVLDAADEIFPRLHVPLGLGQVQVLEHDAVQPLGGEDQRHLVDGGDVLGGDDRLLVDVAEQGDLALDVGIEEAVGAAEQDIGLDADRSQIADAVLCRLGLELAGRADEGDQRQVDVERVVAPDVLAELADRLEERQALDVADRAADLDQRDVDALRRRADGVLDLVGDVRDDLHGPPQVLAAALLLDDALIDFAGRPVRVA
jgi:hypothetical protein